MIRSEADSSPVLDSEVSGTMVSLRERFEAVRLGEIHRLRGRLGDLSPNQEEVVDSLSRDIIEKVLHVPVSKLLSATARNQLPEIVQTLRRIFNLHS